jgi:hypothetical protein
VSRCFLLQCIDPAEEPRLGSDPEEEHLSEHEKMLQEVRWFSLEKKKDDLQVSRVIEALNGKATLYRVKKGRCMHLLALVVYYCIGVWFAFQSFAYTMCPIYYWILPQIKPKSLTPFDQIIFLVVGIAMGVGVWFLNKKRILASTPFLLCSMLLLLLAADPNVSVAGLMLVLSPNILFAGALYRIRKKII